MKPFHQANEEILKHLFRWKQQQGEWIRYDVFPDKKKQWVLHFYSVDHRDRDRHIFASFSGNNPEEMKRWALTLLASFKMEEAPQSTDFFSDEADNPID